MGIYSTSITAKIMNNKGNVYDPYMEKLTYAFVLNVISNETKTKSKNKPSFVPKYSLRLNLSLVLNRLISKTIKVIKAKIAIQQKIIFKL